MEWKISDSREIFSVDLNESEGVVTISSMSIDGQEGEVTEIRISKAEEKSRISIEINGNPKFAHVTKVGDRWWMHIDGEIYTVDEMEKGGKSSDKAQGGLSAPMPVQF